jgi:hypothetical protein
MTRLLDALGWLLLAALALLLMVPLGVAAWLRRRFW